MLLESIVLLNKISNPQWVVFYAGIQISKMGGLLYTICGHCWKRSNIFILTIMYIAFILES